MCKILKKKTKTSTSTALWVSNQNASSEVCTFFFFLLSEGLEPLTEINRSSQSLGALCSCRGSRECRHVFFIRLIQACWLQGSAEPAPPVPNHTFQSPPAQERASRLTPQVARWDGNAASQKTEHPSNDTKSMNKWVSPARHFGTVQVLLITGLLATITLIEKKACFKASKLFVWTL